MKTTLTVEEQIQIASACESVWDGIAHDISVDQVTAKEMVELSADCSRLESYGHSTEQQMFTQMVNEMGYREAVAQVADRCQFDGYEGGSSQAY